MFSKIRPLIFKLDPELAHDLAIKALKTNLIVKDYKKNELILKTKLFGKEIPNPIGIACLLYTSPSPRDKRQSRMPSSA